MRTKDTVEVPKEILIGLYRIACGTTRNFSGHEVYEEAKCGMTKALDWILDYGEDNNIEMRGWEEHKLKNNIK